MNDLAGLRIVVTRAAHQAAELAGPLLAEGAQVILLPMIALGPPDHPEELAVAAEHADTFDWIVFSSTNAVTAFAQQLVIPASDLLPRIAAVGAATRQFAEAQGFSVSLIPERYLAEALIEAFREEDLKEKRILIPRAAVARDIIPTELRKMGAHVTVVEAYCNVLPPEAKQDALNVFRPPLPNWVLFASSSAVENLIPIVGTGLMEKVLIGTIGPVTSATLRKYGLTASAEAGEHNVPGLVASLKSFHKVNP